MPNAYTRRSFLRRLPLETKWTRDPPCGKRLLLVPMIRYRIHALDGNSRIGRCVGWYVKGILFRLLLQLVLVPIQDPTRVAVCRDEAHIVDSSVPALRLRP